MRNLMRSTCCACLALLMSGCVSVKAPEKIIIGGRDRSHDQSRQNDDRNDDRSDHDNHDHN